MAHHLLPRGRLRGSCSRLGRYVVLIVVLRASTRRLSPMPFRFSLLRLRASFSQQARHPYSHFALLNQWRKEERCIQMKRIQRMRPAGERLGEREKVVGRPAKAVDGRARADRDIVVFRKRADGVEQRSLYFSHSNLDFSLTRQPATRLFALPPPSDPVST